MRTPEQRRRASEATKRWQRRNPAKVRQYRLLSNLNYKLSALFTYGGKCQCCGEDRPAMLTLDHVNQDGAKHRREIFGSSRKNGASWYAWLQKHNYPNNPPLQVLCYNCNCGRRVNRGICPHKELP